MSGEIRGVGEWVSSTKCILFNVLLIYLLQELVIGILSSSTLLNVYPVFTTNKVKLYNLVKKKEVEKKRKRNGGEWWR